MDAVVGDQADIPALIFEKDEVFAQDADELRGLLVGQFAGDGDRVPVAAEQLARRCARPDARQQLVLFLRQHMLSILLSFVLWS